MSAAGKGFYRITTDWGAHLPEPFDTRVEAGSLVLNRPGITIWINTWPVTGEESRAARYERLSSEVEQEAFDVMEESFGPQREAFPGVFGRLAYRVEEPPGDPRPPPFFGFIVGEPGHVQLAAYFDEEDDVFVARYVWRSIRHRVHPVRACQ